MTTEAQKKGLGKYADMEFTLGRADDDTIELFHDGVFVARFPQCGATEEILQSACADHLTNHHPDRLLNPRMEA